MENLLFVAFLTCLMALVVALVRPASAFVERFGRLKGAAVWLAAAFAVLVVFSALAPEPGAAERPPTPWWVPVALLALIIWPLVALGQLLLERRRSGAAALLKVRPREDNRS